MLLKMFERKEMTLTSTKINQSGIDGGGAISRGGGGGPEAAGASSLCIRLTAVLTAP